MPGPPQSIDGGEEVVPAVRVEEHGGLGGNVEVYQGAGGELDHLDAVLRWVGKRTRRTARRGQQGGANGTRVLDVRLMLFLVGGEVDGHDRSCVVVL